MRRVKLTAIAAIAASGLVGLGLAASGTAHAGTKGQQIRVCSADGDYRQVVLEGNNQNGEYEKVSNAFARGCTPISDYWWVQVVKISLTDSASGAEPRERPCLVPIEQPTSDWVECRVDVPEEPSPTN